MPCTHTAEPGGVADGPVPASLCPAGSLIPAPVERRISAVGPDRAAPPPAEPASAADPGDQAAQAASPSLVLGIAGGTAEPAPGAETGAGPPYAGPVAGPRLAAKPGMRISRTQARTDRPEPPGPPAAPACGKETRSLPKPPPETFGDLPRPGQAPAGHRLELARHVGTPALSGPAEDPAVSPD